MRLFFGIFYLFHYRGRLHDLPSYRRDCGRGLKEETGIDVLVSGLGSSAGIEAVSAGTADIASSSRGLNADEQDLGLTPIVIAHDGIAVIVNDDNPVDNLSTEQLRDIYAARLPIGKRSVART